MYWPYVIAHSTIRVWKGDSQCDKMEAHKPAVWAIAGLFDLDGTKRVLSGWPSQFVHNPVVDLCMYIHARTNVQYMYTHCHRRPPVPNSRSSIGADM